MLSNREKLIALVDNDIISKSDAIIMLEGDGYHRCSKAIELYKSGFADTLVFSGGIINHPYGSFPFNEVLPYLLKGGIPFESIIHEKKSQHTREQAIEVIKLAVSNKWSKLILVASHYHQYRAYLTFLKEIIDSKINIILFNAPANNLKWFKETDWGKRFDLLDNEFDRIEKYTALSHLATIDEVIEYQKWKELQL